MLNNNYFLNFVLRSDESIDNCSMRRAGTHRRRDDSICERLRVLEISISPGYRENRRTEKRRARTIRVFVESAREVQREPGSTVVKKKLCRVELMKKKKYIYIYTI